MDKLSNISQFFNEDRFVYMSPGGGETPEGNVQPLTKINKPQGTPEKRAEAEVYSKEENAAYALRTAKQGLKEMNTGIKLAKRIIAKAAKDRTEVASKGSSEALMAYDKCTKDEDYAFNNVEKRSKFKVLIKHKMTPADWQKVADFLLVNDKTFITTYANKHGYDKFPKILSDKSSLLPSQIKWARSVYEEVADKTLPPTKAAVDPRERWRKNR